MHNVKEKRIYFDELAPRWIHDIDERSSRLGEIFAEYHIPVPAPVLDVGSGTGILLPLLRERTGMNASIVELEVSHEMLRLARDMNSTPGAIHYIQADAHTLPFPTNAFASAFCFSVYPHFSDPQRAIAELHRCLQPGGLLLILHLMGHRELNAMHGKARATVSRDVMPPVDVLARSIADAKFTVERMEERCDLYLLQAKRSD